MSLSKKPANATWVAKANVSADDDGIDFPLEAGTSHPLGVIDLPGTARVA